MSIKPIDMQIMLNNTANVNKINNPGQQQGEQQLMFSQHLKDEISRDNERTVQTNKSEEEKIKDDQEGNKGKYNKNKKEKEKEEKNSEIDESVKKNKSSSIFDVSI